MDLRMAALNLHKSKRGKIEMRSKVKIEERYDLSLAYSPGVAEPCREISRDPSLAYEYTNKGNTVAVITDGTAVLGLGNIGPEAALPVMEGKALLFKEFADIDAFPLCLNTQKEEEIVETIARLAPSFAGINLEDISAPRCFSIEEKLDARLKIPVFHDDQHGTAVIVLAGLLNALRVVGKKIEEVKIVVNGAGAAGQAITRLLYKAGARRLRICDLPGILYPNLEGIDPHQRRLAELTNAEGEQGDLSFALQGADVLIGVSTGHIVTGEMVKAMAPRAIIFAMANPDPEIDPAEAKLNGAAIVGTGRSDQPNQINNLLGFPGIFRGALDVRAKKISEGMMMAAARAIAGLIKPEELSVDYVVPSPFDRRVVPVVALAVGVQALKEGLAGLALSVEELKAGLVERFGPWE
ncbi:MAG: NADP-dependent malic enzyme [Firmicutes bacterium]|nr:NADP-dependent malic enzyme [Bacillota bacterium]